MIRHIVLFKFKKSLNQNDIQQIADLLLNMRNKISQIKDCKWITNIHDRNHDYGFKHGISIDFANQKDLQDYIAHQHHAEVCEHHLFPSLEDGINGLLVFDYEMMD